MKDLVFTCSNGEKSIYCAYNTVMDFLDDVDENKVSLDVLNAANFNATFFENEFNTYNCDSLASLYNHCNDIIA